MRRPIVVVTSDDKRLTLTSNLKPQVVITFKDGTKLQISGQNLTQSADYNRLHDGQPNLLRNRKPVQDPRLKLGWPTQVKSVVVSQAAGPHGIYLGLVAIGWGPAVRRRIDVLGTLEVQHVRQIKSAEDLLSWIIGMLRLDARPHFSLLNAA